MNERRHSKKRDAILNLIRSTKSHPGAQWVYECLKPQYPDLSLGTVYRNIKVLIGEGAVVSAGVINGEERFDGDIYPHSHAVCKRCGLIVDLSASAKPAKIPGFSDELQNIVFYGICDACKSGGQ